MIKSGIAYLYLTAALTLLCCGASVAQPGKNFKTMSHIRDEWEGRGACDTLYYRDAVEPAVIDSTISLLRQKSKFVTSAMYSGKPTTPLLLSPAEKQYLIAELRKLKTFRWPGQMFPQAKLVTSAAMADAVLRRTAKLPGKKANHCSIIYSFSKPIYIRNKTVALYLSQEQYTPKMTQLSFDFYKLSHGEWETYADGYINYGSADEDDDEQPEPVQQARPANTAPVSLMGDENAGPEKLVDFGKKVVAAFKSDSDPAFEALYPTYAQIVAFNQKLGMRVRERSAEEMKYRQEMVMLQNMYNIHQVQEAAKQMQVKWNEVQFQSVNKDIKQLGNAAAGKSLPYAGATITCSDNSQTFKVVTDAIFYIDGQWKLLGPVSISK